MLISALSGMKGKQEDKITVFKTPYQYAVHRSWIVQQICLCVKLLKVKKSSQLHLPFVPFRNGRTSKPLQLSSSLTASTSQTIMVYRESRNGGLKAKELETRQGCHFTGSSANARPKGSYGRRHAYKKSEYDIVCPTAYLSQTFWERASSPMKPK